MSMSILSMVMLMLESTVAWFTALDTMDAVFQDPL